MTGEEADAGTVWAAAAARIMARADAIAACTETPGQVNRPPWTEAFRAAHDLLRAYMTEAGLDVHLDPAGNLLGLRPAGRDAGTWLVGSHIDSVPDGGRYDGVLGILIGIELAAAHPDLPFEVVALAEEEGVRFPATFLGSRALTGELPESMLTMRDRDGLTFREVLTRYGLDADAAVAGSTLLDQVRLFFEVHAEQGPVLESLGAPLSVADVIAGQTRMQVVIDGTAGHAGTVPMSLRRDPMPVAARCILAVQEAARAHTNVVGTVGRVRAEPGAPNVIPGRVTLTVDVRSDDDAARGAALQQIAASLQAAAQEGQVEAAIVGREDRAAVVMDAPLSAALAMAIAAKGYPVHHLPSGAGHDAMVIARHKPTVLLFVRSPGGLSHCPGESVLEEDVAAALDASSRFFSRLQHTAPGKSPEAPMSGVEIDFGPLAGS